MSGRSSRRFPIVVASVWLSLAAGCATATDLGYEIGGDAQLDSKRPDGESVDSALPTDSKAVDDSGVAIDSTAKDSGSSGDSASVPDTGDDTGDLDTGDPDTGPVDTGPLDTGTPPPPDTGTTSDSFIFVKTGDTASVLYEPNFWNAGDYYQGTRTTTLATATSLKTTINITNSLSIYGGKIGTVKLTVSLNGTSVGTVLITPSSGTAIPVNLLFPAITGPTYVIKYLNPTVVASGCGSIKITKDISTVTLK